MLYSVLVHLLSLALLILMTATGVSTISSFITVLCKLKRSVSTQLVNSIHVDMFHTLTVVYQ